MKKYLIPLLLFILIITYVKITDAEECVVARPYYGSINCIKGGFTEEFTVDDGETWTCQTEACEIRGITPNDFSCSGLGFTRKLELINQHGTNIIPNCDSTFGPLGDEEDCRFKETLRNGDRITVDFSCNLGEPEGDPKVLVRYEKLELELNIDSGKKTIDNTEMCNINKVYDQYSKEQLQNNNILKTSGAISALDEGHSEGLSSIPSGSDIVGDLKPTQLRFGQGYWFVYEWVERPSLIVATYKGNNVWCNVIDHSLIKLQDVTTIGGRCYSIPSERLNDKAECCSTDECKNQYTNKNVLCTNDFKCGFEKSCLSDLDCGGTSEVCEENYGKYNLVKSYCDKSELDSYSKGSCKSEKKSVNCCSGNDGGPNSCGSGKFCDYSIGCKEVTFENSEGKIQTGVGGQKTEEISNDATGLAVIEQTSGSSLGITILIIIMVAVVGVILYYKFGRKSKSTHSSATRGSIISSESCTTCDSPVRPSSKFCTKCGKSTQK